MQALWYRKVLMRDLQTLSDGRGGKGSTHAQNIVMHLRKVCNHPYLFEGAEPGPPFIDGEHMVENCGKMVVLDKLLKRLLPGGHRVLIFVTMTRMLDIIEDYCNLRKYEHRRAVSRRPRQCPSSAAAPPLGAPGGRGRSRGSSRHTPREGGRAHWAPSHHCASSARASRHESRRFRRLWTVQVLPARRQHVDQRPRGHDGGV